MNNLSVRIKTVAASATPEVLSAASVFAKNVRFYGRKAARTANTGVAYVQLVSTNDSVALAVPNDGTAVELRSDGPGFDLADFWIDVATAGDGVEVWAWD